MSNNSRQIGTNKRVNKPRFRPPFIFWFSMVSLAIVITLVTSYVLYQKELRVTQAAKVSANGLASFVSDYLIKHRLMAKSLAYHNQDRILKLSKGAGYPYDLAEIENDVNELFPPETAFAIINSKAKIVVGSHIEHVDSSCEALIKSEVQSATASTSHVRAHKGHDGEFHFDILTPVLIGDEWAGFWIKLSFKPFQRFIQNLNVKDYELLIVDKKSPYSVFLGDKSMISSLHAKNSGIFSHLESLLSPYYSNQLLASAPVENMTWQVQVIQPKATFAKYFNRVVAVAFVMFLMIFIISIIIYLSFRKLQEEKAKLKQAEYHDQLFNAGPTVLLEKKIDREMSILYASPNVQNLLGREAKSLVAKSFLEWIYPDDVDSVKEKLITAYVSNSSKVEMVYRLKVNGNGGYKWIYDLSHILYNRTGKPDMLRGYITSIHAQKTAEKNATDLIQSIPESIFVIDTEGRILNTNTAAEQMLHCSKTDLQNQLFSLWLESDSYMVYEQLKQQYMDVGATAFNLTLENEPLYLRDGKGKRISVEVSFNQLELNDKTLLVQVVRDITLQQKHSLQLNLAKERAEALAKARSRFVATISHEIRTPMNGVLGMTDLLLDSPLNDTQAEYVKAIKHSGDILLKIINEVLDFAKLDDGQVVLANDRINLPSLVEEALHSMSSIAEDKQLALTCHIASDVPELIQGDSIRLKQLIMNLIDNGLKFTEQGEVSVIVSIKKADDQERAFGFSDRLIYLEVKDTGIGIAKENLSQWFESFSQGDSSITRQFGGTGLGLSICKKLVDLMEGQIGGCSLLNEGSCFWVKLPCQITTVMEPKKQNVLENKNASTPQEVPLLGKQILLIEDNEINQRVIEDFLNKLGANVDVAENGLKGVELWRIAPQKYQLVIMDCQMPVMDGFEATRIIRKEELLSTDGSYVPIVALTKNVGKEDRKRCIQAGMNDFLAKPIEMQLFNEVMIKWCL